MSSSEVPAAGARTPRPVVSSSSGAGSPAVREAVHEAVRVRAQGRDAPVRVVDVGGGSGVWAVPLALVGCEVVVVDPSPDSLASLARRAREAGVASLVTGVQGDAASLGQVVADGSADLVLAHGVLEVVDEVSAAVTALVRATAPGGTVSVVVAGRAAAMLHRALAGRLTDARNLLTDPAGRCGPADPLLRRFDVAGLELLLVTAGLQVTLVQGDGVVSDLVPHAVLESTPGSTAALAELERLASGATALREVASRLHALARVPDDRG